MKQQLKKVKKLTPQQETLLDHFKLNGSITRIEGIVVHGMGDVLKRISELRALGYDIDDEWRKDAKGRRYKRYFWNSEQVLTDEETINA